MVIDEKRWKIIRCLSNFVGGEGYIIIGRYVKVATEGYYMMYRTIREIV